MPVQKEKQTYICSKKCPVPLSKYIQILLVALALAFFIERYCFIMIVYKVKNYGALLIVEVIAANSIFLAIIKKVRRNKKKSTRVIELDIQNVINRLNTAGDYYDSETQSIETYSQLGFLPVLNYRIEF